MRLLDMPFGNLRRASWETGHTATLLFERDDNWTMLTANHPGMLPGDTEAQLAQVGASMSAY
jgi:hypothetical protein